MTDFILTDEHIKVPRDVCRHAIIANCFHGNQANNQKSQLLTFEGYGLMRLHLTANLPMPHLLGAVVLQHAMTEFDYATKSRLYLFPSFVFLPTLKHSFKISSYIFYFMYLSISLT